MEFRVYYTQSFVPVFSSCRKYIDGYNMDQEYEVIKGFESFEGAKVVDGDLYLWDRKMDLYNYYHIDNGMIPSLYTVRAKNGRDYYGFQCGLDLLKDGQVWLGAHEPDVLPFWEDYVPSQKFKSIIECFEYLDEAYSDYYVDLEEPMQGGTETKFLTAKEFNKLYPTRNE
jgi:hypothetical protein